MCTYIFLQLTEEVLKSLVTLVEKYMAPEAWEKMQIPRTVSDIETEKPTFTLEFSPVYNGIWDAAQIVQLLKFIVAKHLAEEK